MATEIIRFFQPFPSICGLDVAAEKNVPKIKKEIDKSRSLSKYHKLCIDAAAGEILLHHEGYLEGDGIVKLTEVEAGELLDLLETIHQRIAVDEQLAGGFGHVQVVLKELVDGTQVSVLQRKPISNSFGAAPAAAPFSVLIG